ncbi:MAG TPA: enolase C-terminal domain-like protein, partial [Acidimicrobiales bacterium]|nr:enolase C-terminal domain-like protein [Acidimicrobiales bacterium]
MARFSEDGPARPTRELARDLGTVQAIETVRWKQQPNLLWTLVRTSGGAVGLGETYYLPGAVERVIHDLAAELFIGEPAGAISKLWSAFFSCTNFFGFAGAEMRALSALDVALWDALGQSTGLPLYQLLGGACRATVPAYNTCVNAGVTPDWDRALEEPAALAAELRDLGYLGMKVWPWDRFAPQLEARGSTGPAGWSAMGPVGTYLAPADLAAGLSVFEAARDRVGAGFELLLEGHGRWDVNMAVRICRAVEPVGLLWAEDVCQPDSAED